MSQIYSLSDKMGISERLSGYSAKPPILAFIAAAQNLITYIQMRLL